MCDYVFDSGDNAGEECNKTIFKLTRCRSHKIKEEKKQYPKCVYLFTKGEKRDTLCNKNVLEEGEELCKPHKNAKLKKIELTKTEDYKKWLNTNILFGDTFQAQKNTSLNSNL